MSAEALTFGPEWLRALSGGGGSSVTSPPASPAGMYQFKLAEHRYGREEMLALYKKTEKPPFQMDDFQSIGKKECLTPMALTPLNEEEQRCLSQCVNSSVVLRITGRGAGGAGPPSLRGARGTGRGRGRGRGDYQRSVSNYDDGDSGGFGIRREFNRTLSWDEGNDHRLYDKSHRTDSRNYDDTGPPSPRKHIERGSLSDNWRIPRERQLSRTEEEDGGDGGWRHANRPGRSPRDNNDDNWRTAPGSTRTNWHHPRERPPFDGDRERPPRDFTRPGENRERRYSGRNRQDSWHETNEEEMPEWTMDDDPFDLDSIGTFDATGAFCAMKPEDIKKFEEEKAALSKGAKEDKEKNGDLEKEKDKTSAEENHKPTKQRDISSLSSKSEKSSSSDSSISDNKLSPHSATSNNADQTHSSNNVSEVKNEARTSPLPAANAKSKNEVAVQAKSLQDIEALFLQSSGKVAQIDATESAKTPAVAAALTAEVAANKTAAESVVISQEQKLAEAVAASGVMAAAGDKAAVLEDEDDGLEHLEKAAESLMAELDEGDDDKVPDIDVDVQVASDSNKALAATHENAQKWLYKDPQGQVQGPFQSAEMAEWFSAGYFTMSLLVKRGCDEEYLCLGDVIKRWGRVPFVQGPEPPPLAQKAAVSAPPASSVAPSVSPPVLVQAALAAAAAQQQASQQTQPQPAAPQVLNPNPQIAQLLAQVQAAAAAAVSQQQQQQQQHQQAQQQQQQHQQQQQQAMHQQQVFQQVLQQQQALIRVHASRIYSELVQRGQTLTPSQQQILRQQLITLQQQHQLLLKQQQQYQSLAQLSMAGEGPGSGDHPPSIPTHSQAAAVAAAQAAAAAAIQSSNQQAAGKDGSKSVMENISMWGVPHKDRGEWDIGFWDPSMAKEIIEEERKFRELERLRKAEEHRKQVEQAAEEERQTLEEMRRQQEVLRKEEQKIREEENKRQEEMQKMDDESGNKMAGEYMAYDSEENKRKEDLKRQEEIRRLEDLQRADEERRQEEQRRIEQQRQDDVRRQQEESSRKAQEEANRRAQEEASRRAQDEAAAARRAQEEDAARRVAQEEASKRRAREEQEKLRQEDDRKNSERQRQELMRQQEMQRQQEAQRQQQQQEALRRLQQQQQQQSKLPSTAMWGQNTATTSATPTTSSSGTPTLSQIQQLQAQQEERDREEQRQRQMAQLQQQQQHQQQQSQNRPGWGSTNPGIPVSVSGPTKSLREIQEEQARQQLERSKQQQAKAQVANLSMATATSGVWGSSSNSNSMAWGNEPISSWGNPQQTNKAAPMGFWDECARDATNTNPVLKTNSNNANFPALRGSAPSTLQQQQRQQNANKSRSAKEEETVRKLFQASLPSDEFTQWCEYMLQGMASSVDIPTFITFLQDVESPYEVHDYVKMYLGESRDTAEFARQFLERRNRQREQQRKQREMESGQWTGQPVKGHPQQENLTGMGDWEDVSRGNSGMNNKKKKKAKQLVDPSILGFSVNAAERPNIGEIQSIND